MFVYFFFLFSQKISVAIQCLESTYGINTQDQAMVKKLAVPRNLLDIFNSQIIAEVWNLNLSPFLTDIEKSTQIRSLCMNKYNDNLSYFHNLIKFCKDTLLSLLFAVIYV